MCGAGPVAAEPRHGRLAAALAGLSACRHPHAATARPQSSWGVSGGLAASEVRDLPPLRVAAGCLGRSRGAVGPAATRLVLLLGAPAAWLLVAYLGSLAALLLTSLYRIDDSGLVVEKLGLVELPGDLHRAHLPDRRPADHRRGAGRHRSSTWCWRCRWPSSSPRWPAPRWRALLVAAVLVPLWASYLVKAYAWRAILGTPGGVLESTFGHSPGYSTPSVVLVLAYLWLPYMVLPIYAGLERLPGLAAGGLGRPRGQGADARSASSCCRSCSPRSWPGRSSPSRCRWATTSRWASSEAAPR